jgi:hypothetical protein
MQNLKEKFLNNPEDLTEEEIKELSVLFINWVRLFFNEEIHGKTLISDLNGLNNILETLIHKGLDPM